MPAEKYTSLESAQMMADRYSKQEPDKVFFVYFSFGCVYVSDKMPNMSRYKQNFIFNSHMYQDGNEYKIQGLTIDEVKENLLNILEHGTKGKRATKKPVKNIRGRKRG